MLIILPEIVYIRLMYYTEQTEITKVEHLLEKCGLSMPAGVEYTAGIFTDSGELAATGSLKGDMIQAVAVNPAHQGEDLMGKLLTHLIGVASEKGLSSLHLFTKPDKAVQFQGLGLRLVASARPYAALLEWGTGGIEQYTESLRRTAKQAEAAFSARHGGKQSEADSGPETISALVMNCNPFTLGHRYLVEQAASASDIVYLLVVEEDKSLFSFKDRLEMVRRGVADLENVMVISGGRYAVSSLTFPSYFTKEENLAKAHTAIDAEIFRRHIAPALGVKRRFLGTEPLSAVTAVYNETLKDRLPGAGIEVTELARLEKDGAPVSASRVRALLGESLKMPSAEVLAELAGLLPATSLEYMMAEVFYE